MRYLAARYGPAISRAVRVSLAHALDSGEIASRPREARDETREYRIVTGRHDDGDHAGGFLGGEATLPLVTMTATLRRTSFWASAGKAHFERDVLALDVAEFAKLLSENRPPLQAPAGVEQPDDRSLGGWLRVGLSRCGQAQAEYEQRENSLSSVHSIIRGM